MVTALEYLKHTRLHYWLHLKGRNVAADELYLVTKDKYILFGVDCCSAFIFIINIWMIFYWWFTNLIQQYPWNIGGKCSAVPREKREKFQWEWPWYLRPGIWAAVSLLWGKRLKCNWANDIVDSLASHATVNCEISSCFLCTYFLFILTFMFSPCSHPFPAEMGGIAMSVRCLTWKPNTLSTCRGCIFL